MRATGWAGKSLLLVAAATACFASAESRLSRASIAAMEDAINAKFRVNSPDPYDLLGTARGTYLEGYGVVFTVELQLVNVSPPSPFNPKISDAEVAQIRDRKLKKLPQLKEAMRSLMATAGSSLANLPPEEKISMEAILWSYSWESTRGMPHRVFLSVQKQKLLEALAAHTDPALVIEEQER